MQSLCDILKHHKLDTRLAMEMHKNNYEYYQRFGSLAKKQIGGSKLLNFKFNNKIYNIYHVEQEDVYSYSLKPKDNENELRSCFIIFIDKRDSHYAYIDTISSYEDCPHIGHMRNGRGSHLLKVVLAFVDSLKDKYQLKYVQLKDNSLFACKTKGKIELSALYMLTQGDTWYGKYGFKPFNVDKQDIDIENYVDYKVNSKLVNIIKVNCTNLKDLITKAARANGSDKLNDEGIEKIFKIYNKKTIKDFFKMFMSNYDLTCEIFYDIYKDFMENVGIRRLYGISYFRSL